jgi:glycosyltransferase involved in cell wall biosynthesis
MKQAAILLSSLRGGGTERELLTLAGELLRQGLDLDLVLVNRLGSAYAESPGINVINLDASRIRHALQALVRYLRAARPRVLLSAETPVNVLAVLGRIITGFPKRLVLSEHNHLSSVARHEPRFADRMRPLLARLFYPRADLVIAVSDGVAADLIRSCGIRPQQLRTIHNMFNIEEILARSRVQPGDAWLQGNALPLILNVGRLSPQKDQANLIRAFAMVRTWRKCRLLILGEGPERARLQALAGQLGVEDALIMPGFVENPYAYMGLASVFALSSAWEGLPGVLIEALACGTPVVSTDCLSGPAEILEGGLYGRLTPVGDPTALAQAIIATMEQPLAPEVLRRRAADFSIQRVLPDFLGVFEADGQPHASLP